MPHAAFDVEHDASGTRLTAHGRPITDFCTTDADVDFAVALVKHELDKSARRMKAMFRGAADQSAAPDAEP